MTASRAGTLAQVVGQALRRARQARGLTLRDVGERSEGRFKPTAVAGYERAERSISLERFCELSGLYEMAPERLLSQILWHLNRRPEPTIDRSRVMHLPLGDRDALSGFIDQVRRMRTRAEDGTITLRIPDLEVLATVSGRRLEDFLEDLRPALVSQRTPM
jgi:transcriptional regulator with XRE-family HTH domain